MRDHGWTKINAKVPDEQEWKETVNYIHAMTLRHYVERSWYMGELTSTILTRAWASSTDILWHDRYQYSRKAKTSAKLRGRLAYVQEDDP